MKLNEDKCHLMIFGDKRNDISLYIGNVKIKESKEEKFLGVILDKTLCFKQQVKSICKEAGQKLHALSRISHFLDTEQLKRIMRAFILSQFNYCPLVWMFCNRTLDNKVNRIHERALRITYKDMRSDFDTMLLRDNAVTIHTRNLQLLMTEIYKTKWELNLTFMKEIFVEKHSTYGLTLLIGGFLDPCSTGGGTKCPHKVPPLRKVANIADMRTKLGTMVTVTKSTQ